MKMKSKLVGILGIISVFAMIFVAGISIKHDTQVMASDIASVGSLAPDFILKDLDGKKVRLSDYRGSVVFLNFWATWCPPCRAEMPSMEKLKEKMKGKDFIILAVSIDTSSPERLANFIKKNGYTFDILHDSEKTVAKNYLVMGIPTTYIIDKKGVIIEKSVGAETWDKKERIDQMYALLGKKRAPEVSEIGDLQIEFEYNSDKINSVSEKELEDISKVLKGDLKNERFLVVGHTDNIGSKEYNLDLSLRRARNVVSYLEEKYAIPSSRFEIEGKGESQPISTNDTEEGRAKNRRIEFIKIGN